MTGGLHAGHAEPQPVEAGTHNETRALQCSSPLPLPPFPAKYESASKLVQLVKHAESDAWLSMGLAFYLSVLPLTKQLVGGRVGPLFWL